jgi:hypothetical protein
MSLLKNLIDCERQYLADMDKPGVVDVFDSWNKDKQTGYLLGLLHAYGLTLTPGTKERADVELEIASLQ